MIQTCTADQYLTYWCKLPPPPPARTALLFVIGIGLDRFISVLLFGVFNILKNCGLTKPDTDIKVQFEHLFL